MIAVPRLRISRTHLAALPIAVGGGVVVAADPHRAPLLAVSILAAIFLVLSIRNERVIMVAFAPIIWGVLAANKSFATIGVGPLYIMEALLALTVAAVLVNPVTRGRIARARLPLGVLSFALLLGLLNLWRGRAWGLSAAEDSVIAFYGVALLLPSALFATTEEARKFFRTCVVPLLIGAVSLTLRKFHVGHGIVFDSTEATAAALLASGFVFIVLAPNRLTARRATLLAVLAAGVVVAVARSVWLGCVVAALLGWALASRDRSRLTRIALAVFVAGLLVFTGLTLQKSKLVPKLVGKTESFFFHQTNQSAAPIANSKWRIAVWRQTLDDRIRPNLIAGEGFGRPAVEGTPVGDRLNITDPRTQVHDGYLTYLMREGLIGFAAFAFLVGGALLRTGRRVRQLRDHQERLFALALFCSLCIYIVDIGFGVILEGPMGGIPFWLLVGLAYVTPSSGVGTVQGDSP